ncbi:MAG: hypothetical protein J7559_16800 [Cohnella sp.]|nr:hypothetical protein [Cohnella sp.]
MVATKWKRSSYLFFALLLLIVSADMAFIRMSQPEEDRIVVYAVLFDFALVLPFLYWFMMMRPKGKSIVKVVPLPIVGAAAAWVALPESLRGMVWQTIWPLEAVIIAAELALVGYELRIAIRFIRHFRAAAKHEPNTAESLRIAMAEGFGKGKMAGLLLHDFLMLYYLFFSWGSKRKFAAESSVSRFTYHRTTNRTLYAALITKIIVLEGFAMHLLLQQWSHWAAWIMTIADAWLLALIWADNRASRLQPIRLDGRMLKLRYGLQIQADIPLAAIANIACATEFHPDRQQQKESAVALLSASNVRIEFSQPLQIEGLLFQARTVTCIYLAVDDPKAFAQQVNEAL